MGKERRRTLSHRADSTLTHVNSHIYRRAARGEENYMIYMYMCAFPPSRRAVPMRGETPARSARVPASPPLPHASWKINSTCRVGSCQSKCCRNIYHCPL